jgi:crotonobetainyl-CoA:carnitine CoA-transferase CaiB-like acyl-CoA transferase
MPASRDAASGGPLDGIRVLDLSSVVMAPLATQILGDLGADVITVENRDGDINRVMGPGPHPGLSGVSLNLLRNKRNISLDIAHPDGRDALLRVAAAATGLDELIDALPDDEHPDAGWYKVIPPPTRFSATPATVRRPAPLAGQHTREVLAEAGLTEEEIIRLAEAGVLTGDRAGPRRPAPAG